MTARQAEIIELIRKEVKPALGCTEPIAVALAVAKAMEIIEDKCEASDSGWRMNEGYVIDIQVSGNILKNGMGVGIPGTGMVGLHIAAALGAVCGKSRYGLEVLNDLDPSSIEQAKNMVARDAVKIGLAETDLKLYVKTEGATKPMLSSPRTMTTSWRQPSTDRSSPLPATGRKERPRNRRAPSTTS